MFKQGLIILSIFMIMPVVCEQTEPVQPKCVIKKKVKSASKKEIKEQILDQFDIILQQSSELIRELTYVHDESIRSVKELAMNKEICASKEEYEACQKRLERYTQKMSKVIEEVNVFSNSLR